MRLTILFAWLFVACSGPPPAVPDAGPDAGMPDAGTDAGPPQSSFVLPRPGETTSFFDLPYPSDVRLTPEGTVDLTGFPNPRRSTFVTRYVDAFRARMRGFGTNGAVYFRFTHSVNVATLPSDPEESTSDTATAMIIDVDPASPTFGERHPIVVHYQDAETLYWASHTVAMRPVYGIPLASSRRYAAVITSRVRPADGGDFARGADFEALLGTGGDAAVSGARAIYGDVFTTLETMGIPRSEILAATVFTTQDAVGELLAIRDWMVSQYPPPAFVGTPMVMGDGPAFTEVLGLYGPSPIFQAGTLPYVDEGGAIELEPSGEPTVHGTFDARFSLAVPKTPMPLNGYPVILYAHGTGGTYRSYLSDEGSWLAPLGFAVMGVDQIHHGARNPSEVDPAALFFNFANPDAGRDNNRQSALDVVQQARLVGEVELTGLPGRTEPVRFDASQIYFMGHSQGGLNGPIFLAIDSAARAGMLSAASGVITNSLIEKVDPPPGIPVLVMTLLGLPGGSWQEAYAMEGFTVEHPIATLIQTWIEVADGVNYAHMIFEAPREGFAPKSILMTEGLMDSFSPPASIEALAASMFVPQVQPVQSEIEALALRGIAPTSSGATLNVAGGMATAGLLQYPNDGHFAIYRNDAARNAVIAYFTSLVAGPPGTVP